MTQAIKDLSIADIARRIADEQANQGKQVPIGAAPYLGAMMSLMTLSDKYGYDRGEEVVIYFLSNAQHMRGAVHKELKDELRRRLKEYGAR